MSSEVGHDPSERLRLVWVPRRGVVGFGSDDQRGHQRGDLLSNAQRNETLLYSWDDKNHPTPVSGFHW